MMGLAICSFENLTIVIDSQVWELSMGLIGAFQGPEKVKRSKNMDPGLNPVGCHRFVCARCSVVVSGIHRERKNFLCPLAYLLDPDIFHMGC